MRSEEISAFLQDRINGGDFPSAVYLVTERGEMILQDALGLAVVEPEKIEARIDTIYDLASLTKPLITGLLCAKLIEQGEINLSDKIAKYFGEFITAEKSEITIANLLTHTSGFASWKPFYLLDNKGKESADAQSDAQDSAFSQNLLRIIAELTLENPVNSKVVYSDLNFLTLTFLLEKIYDARLDKIAEKEIFAPLKLENTFYNPPPKIRERIAASEKGNEFEKQTCIDLGFDVSSYDWREYQIWGEVHDGNCWFMKGVSGHAGLFSNAFETFRIAQQFLPDYTRTLKPETCSLFRTAFTKDLNEVRSAAFELAETENSTAGTRLSKDSFGHLGFTGTSLWIDPQKERVFILLTNRTHDRELPFVNTKPTRRRFHELAADILDGK